jgi:hypothetical protein
MNLGLVQMGTKTLSCSSCNIISKVNDWLLEKATEGKEQIFTGHFM